MSASLTAPPAGAAAPEQDVARALAQWLGSAAFARRAEQVRSHTASVVLDTIAAVSAFDEDDTFSAITAVVAGEGADGPATLFATGAATAPLIAATINGAQANATLLSEGHRRAGGHPGAHIGPAVVAAAQSTHASGHALLDAVTAGYEAAVRIRAVVGPLRDGLSPNGNWGAVGAAAGVGWLLSGGDPAVVRTSINTAAALAPAAPMSFGHEGTEGYRHFVGTAAALGLTVGAGAAQGWDAPAGVVEGEYALRSTGHRAPDAGEDAGEDRVLAITENYFKRHAVCAHLSAVGDAAIELHDGGLDPQAIASVSVRCGIPDTCDMDDPRPANRFAARYSLPVVCAVGLIRGAEVLSRFPETILQDDATMSLAARTTTRFDPELSAAHPDGRPTAVLVRLVDGSERESIIGIPVGDAGNPLAPAQLRDKIGAVLVRTRGRSVADAVLAAGDALVADASVDVLTTALEGS